MSTVAVRGEGAASLSREKRLIALLRTYRDARETLQAGRIEDKLRHGTEHPSRLLQMPNAWGAGSYAELETNLSILSRITPGHYWHLAERYIRNERKTTELVNRAGCYVRIEGVARDSREIAKALREGSYESLNEHEEVIAAIPVVNGQIPVRSGERRAVRVRAIVETWDVRVSQRMVGRGVDFLLCMMPRKIRLPREVLDAASRT